MGHIRIGILPKTRKWKQLIGLLNSKESSIDEIATETAKAAKEFFSEKKTKEPCYPCTSKHWSW